MTFPFLAVEGRSLLTMLFLVGEGHAVITCGYLISKREKEGLKEGQPRSCSRVLVPLIRPDPPVLPARRLLHVEPWRHDWP